MIRLTYNSDHLRGKLACSFCELTYPLEGNVRSYRDEHGVSRTHPDARLKVYSHFHYDQNAHMPECPALKKVLSNPQVTRWEAVDEENDTLLAWGSVRVQVGANTVGPILVDQDHPKL